MSNFDFLIGSWAIANRRLRTLFAGSDDWEAFPATSTCQPIFNGGGNTEEIIFPTLGSQGLTVRLLDVERGEWSLYWASSRTGLLAPPVIGAFADGRGDFYGDDVHLKEPIKAHFTWSGITPTTARWEQEFSADGGRSWEANWIMDYTRT